VRAVADVDEDAVRTVADELGGDEEWDEDIPKMFPVSPVASVQHRCFDDAASVKSQQSRSKEGRDATKSQ
jgi:hypothetical protein